MFPEFYGTGDTHEETLKMLIADYAARFPEAIIHPTEWGATVLHADGNHEDLLF